jgi:hypothetical protein
VSRLRLTNGLDWLALAFVLASLVILLTDGFSFRISGVRITARSADRALLAGLAIVALRVTLDRRTQLFTQPRSVLRRVRGAVFSRDADAPGFLPVDTQWRRRMVAALGLCACAVALMHAQLRHLDSVPDLGDPLFSMWRTGWVYHQLQGDPRPLFSPNIFHPHPLTLTYSDSMLLPSLTTFPLLAIGVHPVIAYNIVLVLSFVVSGFAMYLLVERLTGSPGAAFVSALLYGFYPYRFEHYSHFELQMSYWMPLALLALHRFASSARQQDAFIAAGCTAAQWYSSMYYAVFFAMYTAVVFPVLCLLTRASMRRLAAPAALAATVTVLLAAPLAMMYRAAHLGDRDIETVTYYSATTADYVHPHTRSALWGHFTPPKELRPERALFPGIMALILAALALWPPLGIVRVTYIVGLLVAFEISRGFNSPVYPFLYDWLAPIRGLRVPARCSMLVGLSLSVLAGLAVRRLLERRSPSWARGIVGALIVALAVDLRPALDLVPVWPEPPPIYGPASGSRDVVLAEFPMGVTKAGYTSNVPFMYFSLWHWAQMVNGYSGHAPADYADFETAMLPFPDPSALTLMRLYGVTHVSVNCALYYQDSHCQQILEAAEARPELRLVTSAKWQGKPVRLYELQQR